MRGWGSATGGQRSFRHGPADYFEPGTWNIRCWTCFKKIKASEAHKLSVYDGNGWVCDTCFELPNPQNFVRGIPDRQNVPFVQNASPIFVGTDTATGQVPANGNNMVGGPMVGGPMVG